MHKLKLNHKRRRGAAGLSIKNAKSCQIFKELLTAARTEKAKSKKMNYKCFK